MSAVETVEVALADRSYAIRVGAGLIDRAGEELADLLAGRKAVVVADETVAGLHLPALVRGLTGVARSVDALTVPAGESAKSMDGLADLLDRMLALGIDRRTVVIALGGGVTGDLAGFAAAVALRGLDFVQIPTTLLAQVDSSVGGKTGVNTRHGKNLVGAFHQPRRVLIDTAVLDTLPRRELLAGYAEVVKYGAIGDLEFFQWLEANGRRLLDGDADARRHAIVVSCRAKAAVVAADERETAGGPRALLNFGHTFGHALEAMAGYDGSLLHGEGVAAGMVLAARLSARLGPCTGQDAERLAAHLSAVGLPTGLDQVDAGRHWTAEHLIGHMVKDKKALDGRIVFVLLERLGHAVVRGDVDRAAVSALLDRPRAA
ncbi:3-dehydroquinate synthase [Thalassobaculum fulvum]|uniref:3-dehydroquinate synthase n=1 Tax=Thalassobaculum fulvum TaxID=1633335 RepID=A0A919CNT9_9PROT|nr:3-dehydroquinate synthase [Thalassobaculum fulvum]GHD43896.1 3-dehydroquinate synthase [Thalassobaculum fulvum]